MKAKILLIGNLESDSQRSMLGFANALLEGLRANEVECKLIAPKPICSVWFSDTTQGIGKYIAYIDKYIVFSWQLFRGLQSQSENTLVHILDHSNSVYLPIVKPLPTLITCHDLIAIKAALGRFQQHTVGFLGKLQQRWILASLKKAPNIVCGSQATANDVAEILGCSSGPIIPLGLFYPYNPMDGAQAQQKLSTLFTGSNKPIPQNYILHVGSDAWYKNRAGAVEIFSHCAKTNPSLEFIFVGPAPNTELKNHIRSLGLLQRIHFLSAVCAPQLQALYSLAQCLLFPSISEGFGLPLIEAMACGCPVIGADHPAIKEVCADAALYLPPMTHDASQEKWAKEGSMLLESLLQLGPSQRAAVQISCIQRAQSFSRDIMIKRYCALYEAIMSTSQ